MYLAFTYIYIKLQEVLTVNSNIWYNIKVKLIGFSASLKSIGDLLSNEIAIEVT